MKTYLITIKASIGSREMLEELAFKVIKDQEELLKHLNKMGLSANDYSIYPMDSFIDAWNDTDSDMEVLNIQRDFIGYFNMKA